MGSMHLKRVPILMTCKMMNLFRNNAGIPIPMTSGPYLLFRRIPAFAGMTFSAEPNITNQRFMMRVHAP